MTDSYVRVNSLDPSRLNSEPSYYRDNTFMVRDWPAPGLKWLNKIGANIQNITKLRVIIHAVYNPGLLPTLFEEPQQGPHWRAMFEKLATEATGLKELHIYWDADTTGMHWGGGKDASVHQALGKLRGLNTFEIAGYFAKELPAYLKENTGLTVWEESGKDKSYLQQLRRFQRGPTSWDIDRLCRWA